MGNDDQSNPMQSRNVFQITAGELVAQRLEEIAQEVRVFGSPEAGIFASNAALGLLAAVLQGTLTKIDEIFELDGFVLSPACGLMLELFQARTRGCAISTGALCQAVSWPNSVARRWIKLLESMRFLEQFGEGGASKAILTEKGHLKNIEALKLLL